MNEKQYVIETLEKALKEKEEELDGNYRNIKTFENEVAHFREKAKEAILNIAGLRDAISKLKGLANLEEVNKL